MIISPRFSDLEPIFSSNHIAINLNEDLDLEADKVDLNGPDSSGRPGLGMPRLQILHLRTAAVCIAHCSINQLFRHTGGPLVF